MSSSLAHLPYIDFLTAYPHPAFVVQGRRYPDRTAPNINPILGNPSFRSLLLGRDADTVELGRNFLRSLKTVEAAEKFAHWLTAGRDDPRIRKETLKVSLTLPWVPIDADPVELDLTQTVLEDFTVCTSIPCSPLPEFTSPEMEPSPPAPPTTHGRWKMRLPVFPPAPMHIHPNPATLTSDVFSALMRTPTGTGQSSRSPERYLDSFSLAQDHGRKGDMGEMIENYNWHLTPLGPRSEWSPILKSAVEYMLAHPFPVSLTGPVYLRSSALIVYFNS